MFLVLAMLSSAAGQFGGTKSVESIQSLKSCCLISWSLLLLQCSKKSLGGPFPRIVFHLIRDTSCVLGLSKMRDRFLFGGPAKKKRGGSVDWLNCHGAAFAPQWSQFLQITQLATLPTSGGSITDAMIQPLPPLLTKMIEV